MGDAPARSLRANTLTNVGATAVRAGLAFLASLVVTRALGTVDRGTYALLTSTGTLLVMLAGIGVPPALTRLKSSGTTAETLYRSSLLVGLVFGALAAAGFAAAYALADTELMAGVEPVQAAALCVFVPAMLVLSHWTVVAYLDDRILELSAASVAGGVVFVGGVAVLAAAGELDATSALVAWGVGQTLPLAVLLRRRRVTGLWRARRTAASVVRLGLQANLATVALILTWRVDVYFVKGYRGASELGQYAVGVGLAEVLLLVAMSLRVALTPMQGLAHDRHLLVAAISRVTRLGLVVGAAAAAVLGLVAGPLVVLLYGERYGPAALGLQLLLPGVVALALQGPLIDYLLAEGRLKVVTAITVLALAVNVSLNVVLLPRYGFAAAALTSSVAYVLSCAACLAVFARHAGVSWGQLSLPRREDLRAVLRRSQAASGAPSRGAGEG